MMKKKLLKKVNNPKSFQKKVRFSRVRIKSGGYALLSKGKLVDYADTLSQAKTLAANRVRGTKKTIRIIKYEEKDNVGYF